jgi:hypothetical protein
MPDLPQLRVSANRRFLETDTGLPFFWLADTAWELFHRRTLEEAEVYLENRRLKGFNLIQAVAVPELGGLSRPNRYGDLPFHQMDPGRPVEEYFQQIDRVIRLAAKKGLYIGLVTTWADKVKLMWGGEKEIFTPENAFIYGRFLGERYKNDSNLVWILGGDRAADGVEPVWRAMAAGIDAGAGKSGLKTYHPYGMHSSSEWLNQENWLDFNMIQSGHGSVCEPTWELIEKDYNLEPVRPVLDGEPNYEDLPIGFTSQNGFFNDYHVRRQVYRSVFAGGFGVTYGHNSVWQMYDTRYEPVLEPLHTWKEALDRPGASQMVHLKNLILSRPFFTRIPGQDQFLTKPGDGEQHIRATRDQDCTTALVYFPQPGQSTALDLELFTGNKVRAWWFDPCTGEARLDGVHPVRHAMSFTSPSEMPDCVLVIDDVSQNYPPPGAI